MNSHQNFSLVKLQEGILNENAFFPNGEYKLGSILNFSLSP